MIGPYLLLGACILGILFGLYLGWVYCDRHVCIVEDLAIMGLFGIAGGLLHLILALLIACTAEGKIDVLTETSKDDEKVAAFLKLNDLRDIDIKFSDEFPEVYCEVKHNGVIIAPMAKRRETTRVYNKLLKNKEVKTKVDYEKRLDSLIKEQLQN